MSNFSSSSSSSSSSQSNSSNKYKVELHVYDLSRGLAKQMSMGLVGKQIDAIYHTGIVVYGQEFYFGAGIFSEQPGKTRFGTPMEVIPLGETEIPQTVFEDWIFAVRSRFTMHTYNLFDHNCNNFTNEASQFLLDKPIPSHIISLPREVETTPFGAMVKNMFSQQMAPPMGDPNAPQGTFSKSFNTQPNTVHQSTTTQPNTVHHSTTPLIDHAKVQLYQSGKVERAISSILDKFLSPDALESLSSKGLIEFAKKLASAIDQRDAQWANAQTTIDLNKLYALIEFFSSNLSNAHRFAMFDVWRFLMLNAHMNAKFTASGEDTLLEKNLHDAILNEQEKSLSAQLCALRLAANVFAHHHGQNWMSTPSRMDSIIAMVVEALSSPSNACKMAAVSLLLNLVIFGGASMNEDQLLQSVISISHCLSTPNDASLELIRALLIGLGRCLKQNPASKDVVAVSGVDFAKVEAILKNNTDQSKEEMRQIIEKLLKEVKLLMV